MIAELAHRIDGWAVLLDAHGQVVTTAGAGRLRQGSEKPWRTMMSYPQDAKALRGPVADEHLVFGTRSGPRRVEAGRVAHA